MRLLLLAFLSIVIAACKKTSESTGTSLEIKVLTNQAGSAAVPEPMARVILHKRGDSSYVVHEAFSDDNGIVLFTGLTPDYYEADITKSCLDNYHNGAVYASPIPANVVTHRDMYLDSAGYISILNNTSVQYSFSAPANILGWGPYIISAGSDGIVPCKAGQFILTIYPTNTPSLAKDTSLRVYCGGSTHLDLPF